MTGSKPFELALKLESHGLFKTNGVNRQRIL